MNCKSVERKRKEETHACSLISPHRARLDVAWKRVHDMHVNGPPNSNPHWHVTLLQFIFATCSMHFNRETKLVMG
jgi:hypothetical protein